MPEHGRTRPASNHVRPARPGRGLHHQCQRRRRQHRQDAVVDSLAAIAHRFSRQRRPGGRRASHLRPGNGHRRRHGHHGPGQPPVRPRRLCGAEKCLRPADAGPAGEHDLPRHGQVGHYRAKHLQHQQPRSVPAQCAQRQRHRLPGRVQGIDGGRHLQLWARCIFGGRAGRHRLRGRSARQRARLPPGDGHAGLG